MRGENKSSSNMFILTFLFWIYFIRNANITALPIFSWVEFLTQAKITGKISAAGCEEQNHVNRTEESSIRKRKGKKKEQKLTELFFGK